jgi:hypothetical protein
MSPVLTAQEAQESQKNSLFAGKTWKWSPHPWELSDRVQEWLDDLGKVALSFYRAIDLLYRKSWKNDSILRNQDLRVPWVADYYDAGKPDWIISHTRSEKIRSLIPAVLRPDLLPTIDGIALTEWDSVPGGIGLTAKLESIYQLNQGTSMVQSFGASLVDAAQAFGGIKANMVIVVSEEAETYLPEMEWLASELQKDGFSIQACKPEDLEIKGGNLSLAEKRVDLIYRFWELFDHENIPDMSQWMKLVEAGELVVTPPMKHIQEEKLSLALFHHHRLQDFWSETLTPKELEVLRSAIPRTWIVDPVPLPPGSYLDGPHLQGNPISDWRDLSRATKKERMLVLKASGFHETAWGSRSVVIGDDVSVDQWTQALEDAISGFPSPVFVMQEFCKPRKFEHPVFDQDGNIKSDPGRVRLSPYFFYSGGTANRRGTLATFCPADKKIIHGMKDGALMPCDR